MKSFCGVWRPTPETGRKKAGGFIAPYTVGAFDLWVAAPGDVSFGTVGALTLEPTQTLYLIKREERVGSGSHGQVLNNGIYCRCHLLLAPR